MRNVVATLTASLLLATPVAARDLTPWLGDTSSAFLKPYNVLPGQAQPKSWLSPDQFVTPRHDPFITTSPWGPAPYDPGGNVFAYQAKVWAADRAGRRIEIRGTCVSACTMFLGAKNVCVSKNAMLWFHAASDPDTKKISNLGNDVMRAYWPKPVQDYVERSGALRTVSFTRGRALSGVELQAMGLPDCGK